MLYNWGKDDSRLGSNTICLQIMLGMLASRKVYSTIQVFGDLSGIVVMLGSAGADP